MRVVCTSDTHFWVDPKRIPEGDVFIHAGDLLSYGNLYEWYEALGWLRQLKDRFKYLFFVPGNHDRCVESNWDTARQELCDIGFLIPVPEISFTFDGHKVQLIGVPWVPDLAYWAFNRTRKEIKALFAELPRADIAIAHSPPKGVMDKVPGAYHVGTEGAAKYITTHQPPLFVCGHIHQGYGTRKRGKTLIVNGAMCDEDYEQVNEPISVEMTNVEGVWKAEVARA